MERCLSFDKKKKVIFIATTEIDNKSDGVSKKIISQAEDIESTNIKVAIYAYGKNGIISYNDGIFTKVAKYKKYLSRRQNLFFYLIHNLNNLKNSIIYIRFQHCDPLFIFILGRLKKSKCKIFLEIPTFPIVYPKFSINSSYYFKIKLQEIFDFILCRLLKKYVYSTVSIGNNVNFIFGIKNINIPNGISKKQFLALSKMNIAKFNNESEINIACVSNMYKAHGIDRLINGYGHWIKNKNIIKEYSIRFHIIGDGPEKNLLEMLVDNYNVRSDFIFYGKLDDSEYQCILANCNMAVSALAVHRKGLKFASPLKARDYFMHGIPYIYSYNEIGVDEQQPFLKKFPQNDEPINFDEVVNFYESYKNNYEIISTNMKKYANDNLTWEKIFERSFQNS